MTGATSRQGARVAGRGAGAGLRSWPGSERLTLPALGVVVGLGVLARLWSPSPLWLDEAQAVAFAQRPLGDLHAALETDGAPPLYYVLLHGWLQVCDAVGLGEGVWAARSLSMLAAVAALPLVYLAALRLGGSTTHARIALVVAAANPWSVRYAGEARMYSLVALLALVLLLVLDRIRRRPGPGPTLALAAVAAALLYTHYWAVFLLAAVGITVLVRAWRAPADRAAARSVAVGLGGAAALFLPWLPTLLHQSRNTGAPWAADPDLASLAVLPMSWAGGGGPAGASLALVLVPLMLLALFGHRRPGGEVVLGRPNAAPAALAAITALTLTLALAASVIGDGAVVGRYTAVVVPAVLLLVAFGIAGLPRAARPAVLSVVVGLGLAASLTMATTKHSHAGLVADALAERARPGDVLIYCPDQLAPAVEARLELAGVRRVTAPAQPDPTVVDWTDYVDRLAAVSAAEVVDQVTGAQRAGEPSAVWLVSGRGYRTHLEFCPALHAGLVAVLGVPETVLTGRARGYEKARLERFAGPSGAEGDGAPGPVG